MTVSIVNGGLSLLFQELIPAISVTSTELTPATVRTALSERPPNAKARFVNLRISTTGLQVTRS